MQSLSAQYTKGIFRLPLVKLEVNGSMVRFFFADRFSPGKAKNDLQRVSNPAFAYILNILKHGPRTQKRPTAPLYSPYLAISRAITSRWISLVPS